MEVKCAQCSVKLIRRPHEIKRNKNHFCNPQCHGLWNSANKLGKNNPIYKQQKVNCGNCNVGFTVPKYKYNDLQSGKVKNLFCKKSCLQKWQSMNFTKKAKKKSCLHCKNDFLTKNEKIKFCSLGCSSLYRMVVVDLNCDLCGTAIVRKPSMIHDNNFCSVTCRSKWNSKTKKLHVKKECVICKNTYKVKNNQKDRNKCCSKKCLNIWISTVYSKTEEAQQHLIKGGIKSTMLKNFSETKPEKAVREYLDSNHVTYETQKSMYDKFVVDFYLPKEKIVIEVLGDYWHANPTKYGKTDNLIPLTPKQERQINKDKARKAYLETCGHKVIMAWECDIYEDIKGTLKEII
ncbi:hypothetical protein HUB98_06415 [Paenibacillus barcinonensis]|uniref:DNA mismatch endonuclease Vsr n=1 Tax=Paenibacillus barcinonensis TaxID=198119 RepID=A0A2V4VP76_PAEBA|nr:hypothetical protein [Paenibacillus barcinonensis]PYE51651.1 DNA mismatch endonuclease Vsr [Paenibacillus barcinonensis]QKS56012.1 hypothetical protein HUB98_06415 [Paenibacillus barcinonensis]